MECHHLGNKKLVFFGITWRWLFSHLHLKPRAVPIYQVSRRAAPSTEVVLCLDHTEVTPCV